MSAYRYPEALEELVEFLKTLPGVGRRGAERMAFAMREWPADKLRAFGAIVGTLPETVGACPECGCLAPKGGLCGVCSVSSRDRSQICVVENSTQIAAIENSGLFHGLYHALGGTLSPLEGRNAEDLNIESLLTRCQTGAVKEVILALSPDVEGRATAYYLAERLASSGAKVSALARGIPAGADISFANAATIAAALDGRAPLK